jgi:F0F1-type ATP synthase delta subunit
MKYSVQNYAKALVEVIEEAGAAGAVKDRSAVAKNFLAVVRKNGDEARLKKILDEAARLSRGKGGAREVVIESARPLGKSQEKALQSFVKPGDTLHYKIDPDLVAGVKIIINDEMQFDGTMKGKLDKLFI